MVSYDSIKKDPKQFLSVTGHKIASFNILLERFTMIWDDYISHYTMEGEIRQRSKASRKDNVFDSIGSMLVFILSYIKNNPLQEFHASIYGLNQPQCNKWIHALTPLLNKALAKEQVLPDRSDKSLKDVLSQSKEVIMDGTERMIQRPADKDVQREYYSGKKTPFSKKYNHSRYRK